MGFYIYIIALAIESCDFIVGIYVFVTNSLFTYVTTKLHWYTL